MDGRHRRDVLKTIAGAVVLSGTVFGASSTVTAATQSAALPDPTRDPETSVESDWNAFRGDAGRTNAITASYEFDDGDTELGWSAEFSGAVELALDAETVYVCHDDGVTALAADTGTPGWEHESVPAHGPSMVEDTLYVTSEEVLALDRSDGRVRWHTEFEPAETVSDTAVGYGAVFVVVDGSLYALSPEDGSVQWERSNLREDDGAETAITFIGSPAAANGVVYAATSSVVLAYDPDTGDEVWSHDQGYTLYGDGGISVDADALILDGPSYEELVVHDPLTGDERGLVRGRRAATVGSGVYVTDGDQGLGVYDSESDERLWFVGSAYNARPGVIAGDTLYVYFVDADGDWGEYDASLVAFDVEDGTERWTVSASDAPVGPILAIDDATLYTHHDGEIVAWQNRPDDEEDEADADDEDDGGAEDEPDAGDGDDNEDGDEVTDEEPDDAEADRDADESDEAEHRSDQTGADDAIAVTESEPNDGSDRQNPENTTTPNDSSETRAETDDDPIPGFTAGAGLAGVAISMAWLCRQRPDLDDAPD